LVVLALVLVIVEFPVAEELDAVVVVLPVIVEEMEEEVMELMEVLAVEAPVRANWTE
jgi:hypothetical protein